MTSIRIQCCALVILAIVTFFYYDFKQIELKTKKAFSRMLIAANICVFLDITSVLAMIYDTYFPQLLIDALCKLYLVALSAIVYYGFTYLCSDLYPNTEKYKKIILPYRITIWIGSLLIMYLPIEYYCNETKDRIYTYGLSTLVTYALAFIFIISIVTQIYIGRNKINPRRRTAVLIWIGIWILSAIIQYFNSALLIVTFGGVIGVVIIYLMLENPEANFDRETGFFNQNALFQYVSELLTNKETFAVIDIISPEFLPEIYKQPSCVKIFRGSTDEIILLSTAKEGIEALNNLLDKLKSDEWDNKDYQIISMPDSGIANNLDEFADYLRAARHMQHESMDEKFFIINEPFVQKLNEKKRVEELILYAIRSNQVEIYYQPIYSTREDRFCSAEALVRIRDQEGNIVSPGVFIPIAEESHLIVELGRVIFNKLCHFLSCHAKEVPGLDYIEVNLSVVQGENEKLVQDVLDAVNRHHIDTSLINLEITESASISGKKKLLESMECLRKMGFEFSLDDFGTGQSNLNYISEMPVDLVKFDREMIQGYFQSDKTKHILNAAIQMIHEMHLKIVAEGIETKEQFETMKELGIEFIQGYFFSKPIPEDEFIAFMKEHNTNLS